MAFLLKLSLFPVHKENLHRFRNAYLIGTDAYNEDAPLELD